MPYGRRSYRRRRVTRRPRRRQSASKKYVKAVVKRAVQADPHHVELQITDTAVNEYNVSPPYVHPLLTTSTGVTQQSREGKMIQLTGFSIRGSAYRNPASTSHDRLRIVLVKIKDGSTYLPANIYSNLFDVDTSTVSNALQAYRRLDEGVMPNYTVLWDKTLDLGFGATDKSTKLFRITKRFKKPIRCWYNTDSADTPITNDFRLIAISDCTANKPLLSTSSRAWFLP